MFPKKMPWHMLSGYVIALMISEREFQLERDAMVKEEL